MPSDMGSRDNSNRDSRLMSSRILVVCDATKDRSSHEFGQSIHHMRMRGGIVNSGDTIVVLGAMHRVLHPMGYYMEVVPDNFFGTTHTRAKEEQVSKTVDLYVNMLQKSAEECEADGVVSGVVNSLQKHLSENR